MTWEEPPLFDMPATHRIKPLGAAKVVLSLWIEIEVDLDDTERLLALACLNDHETYDTPDLCDPQKVTDIVTSAAMAIWREDYRTPEIHFDDLDHVEYPGDIYGKADLAERYAWPVYEPIQS